MELQQLRYVVAVAETENFTRASERCNVTQPSLSQQVINLEKELGHKLFHRLGRRAVLTESGKVFLGRARQILQGVEDAAREMRDSDSTERSIHVGAIPTLAPSLFAPMLALCRSHHKNLEVHFLEDFSTDLVNAVLEGSLDLAILSLPVKDSRLAVETLFSEPLLLTFGKNHPLASKPKISLDDLRTQDFAVLGTANTLQLEINRLCVDTDFEPTITHRCSQLATLKSLLATGNGVTILPQGTISLDDRSRLISKPLEGKSSRREIGVIRHQLRYQSRGAELFLKLLREHTGSK